MLRRYGPFVSGLLLVGSSLALAPPAPSRPLRLSRALDAATIVVQREAGTALLPVRSGVKRKWPLRFIRRVLWPGPDKILPIECASLPLASVSNELISNSTDSFIARQYETYDDSRLLPAVETETQMAISGRQSRKASLSRVISTWGETTLFGLFDRWSQGAHENMWVECELTGGMLDLLRGQFGLDATVYFDRLAFPFLRVSKGKIKSDRMALNYFKYAPFCQRIPRFTSAFHLEAHDLTLTQKDLFESPCIRHGLRRLLTRILRNRGMKASEVEITSISVLHFGKVSCAGYATVFDSKVDFEVRSGLGVQKRGHVLAFPGLEISLGPAVGSFYAPVVPSISLDMGSNVIISKVLLDGANRTLQLSCRATITPQHTCKQVKYKQNTNAYAASFHFDVGKWLTGVGNFSD